MKKISIILSALVFALVLTQCKKEETPATTNDNNNGVMITLSVGNNSRAVVDPNGNPNWATVSFEAGDYIYVGYNNAYVGYLECTSATTGTGYGHFEGTVTIGEVVEGGKLHFYMLGGKGFQPNPASITDNQLTVNLSDQTTKYPVISYATSNEEYVASTTTYTSDRLKNKCSIMKFNVTTPSSAAICITGMNNKVTLNFNPNTENTDQGFSYSIDEADGGLIKMIGGSGTEENPAVKWAIVLPQEEVSAGTAYTDDGMCTGTRPAIDEIGSNQYLSDGVTMYVNEFTPLATPLTLEALTAGTIVVSNPKSGMQYSLNGGTKQAVTASITVSAGNKVQFYGNGTSINNYNGTKIAGGTAQVKAYGNIMSLVNEENFATDITLTTENTFKELFRGNTTLTDASGLLLPATTLANSCYRNMFRGCTSLTTAPALPAATLTEHCYNSMFYGCTNLSTAPVLPATTLAESCYQGMFGGCTSLTTAPALPVTTLLKQCYCNMFNGCSSLTAAPALPATELAYGCYYGMFSGCSLTTAPALPATTLAYQCYAQMFYNCRTLTAAPALPATTMEEYCYYRMFYGCISLTAAPVLPATTLANYCYTEMFNGCTSLTTAPVLPATTLASFCYRLMFNGCTSLSSITCLAPEGKNLNGTTDNWVNGVASTGTFTKASGATWWTGSSGIPSGWTVNEQ